MTHLHIRRNLVEKVVTSFFATLQGPTMPAMPRASHKKFTMQYLSSLQYSAFAALTLTAADDLSCDPQLPQYSQHQGSASSKHVFLCSDLQTNPLLSQTPPSPCPSQAAGLFSAEDAHVTVTALSTFQLMVPHDIMPAPLHTLARVS
jgi:hypothetical protein